MIRYTRNVTPVAVHFDDDDPIAQRCNRLYYNKTWGQVQNGQRNEGVARKMLGIDGQKSLSVTYRDGDPCNLRRANLGICKAHAPGMAKMDAEPIPPDPASAARLCAAIVATGVDLDAWIAEHRQ